MAITANDMEYKKGWDDAMRYVGFLGDYVEPEHHLLTADERANVLNVINKALRDANICLEVGAYEDLNGVFFNVILMKS